jgi:UDP-2,3-diacylglucosamine hydrolase
MKRIVFFSDVHLRSERGKRSHLLYRFLHSLSDAEAVYILGDLFDFWIGPAQVPLMECREVLEKIRSLSASGVEIYLLHGNRDFLLGKAEEKLLNVKVVGDSASLKLGDKKVYLTHGDLFCTNDTDYLLLRHIFRFKLFQSIFNILIPSRVKLLFARALRQSSSEIVKRKAARTKDISLATVARMFRRGYDVVVCGHMHKARELSRKLRTRDCKLFVLGDWTIEGSYVEYRDGVFSLKKFANKLPSS